MFISGSFSNIRYVQYGIPQGSCLGPILFSISTNDLPLVLQEVKITMYAYDYTLYTLAPTASDLTETLSMEL
jgi:hypothetical protein